MAAQNLLVNTIIFFRFTEYQCLRLRRLHNGQFSKINLLRNWVIESNL